MLITIDQDRERRVAVERHPVRTKKDRPPVPKLPMGLWGFTAALTIVASLVGMSRIGLIDLPFGIGLGAGKPAAPAPTFMPDLPYGKGMWMWQPDKSDGGDVKRMIARAKDVGLSHIYVRTGSSWNGFYAGEFLDKILPAAHAAGIRIYGWDFPRLLDVDADVARAMEAVRYETTGGHRIDGFSADIETKSEGTWITPEAATAYGTALREGVGASYPLIATVPRPSSWTRSFYPYAELAATFDAVAPMVYWLNRQPDTDVAGALADLKQFGKPVFPIGQAYDGAPEGGRPGLPPPDEIQRFMRVALSDGALGVSFWSWQAADQQIWDTIRDAPEFRGAGSPKVLQAG